MASNVPKKSIKKKWDTPELETEETIDGLNNEKSEF